MIGVLATMRACKRFSTSHFALLYFMLHRHSDSTHGAFQRGGSHRLDFGAGLGAKEVTGKYSIG